MRSKWHLFIGSYLITMVLGLSSACSTEESNAGVEALRDAARAQLGGSGFETQQSDSFTSGAMGLQALNPEISVTGDILWSYRDVDVSDSKSDFTLRGFGIHFESYLDPFTRFKAAVSLSEEEEELEEAYLTRFGIWPNANLTLGKFRQQFGTVNRWHKHALDQLDFPLALRMIFGEGGLNQTGASLEWTLATIAGSSQEITVQITDGENDRVFGQNTDNNPSGLARYKIFRDITDSTYVELGVSGLYGQNNEWQVLDAVEEKDLDATVFGFDWTVLWEPTERMRYRNLTWRSEVYALNKDVLAPDGSGEDTISAWGGYSYVESKISRTLILGIRGDYFEPDVKPYAASEMVSMAPLAVTENDAFRWQAGPYLTWLQSPWVHFRIEYNHQDGDGTGPEEDIVWLQCVFAAGPHKHERY